MTSGTDRTTETANASDAQPCRILSLDGGGAKGFYTLGVLREVEALLGGRLCGHFDLIYGTSTGAIIASLLSLGESVDTVHGLYKDHVPRIMGQKKSATKSAARVAEADAPHFSDPHVLKVYRPILVRGDTT